MTDKKVICDKCFLGTMSKAYFTLDGYLSDCSTCCLSKDVNEKFTGYIEDIKN